MVFFAQKVLRKIKGNWTFVVVTDRIELDTQIAKTFKSCGAVSLGIVLAQAGAVAAGLGGHVHGVSGVSLPLQLLARALGINRHSLQPFSK